MKAIGGVTTLYKIVKKVSHFWQKIFIICRTFVVMIYYLIFIHQALERKAAGVHF
jgi:hypothetical protein